MIDHLGECFPRWSFYFVNCTYLILTAITIWDILYLQDKHRYDRRSDEVEIILSNASPKPIYEQITSQIKAMIMNGELKAGDLMPSMRKLAKELHVSVITTQRAYDDLQKDGFIVTVPAKGTFVSAQNQDFIREENRRRVELLLTDAVELAKENGIELEELRTTLDVLYQEEDV